MLVSHWTLIDYAHCHNAHKSEEYQYFIHLFNESKRKGLPLTQEDLLGFFFGMTAEDLTPDILSDFMDGEFKPTHKEYAFSYIMKSKDCNNTFGLCKRVVGGVLQKLRIAKRVNGAVELPAPYFDSLVESYNVLLNTLLKQSKSKEHEDKELMNKLRDSLSVLSKGGLFKSQL